MPPKKVFGPLLAGTVVCTYVGPKGIKGELDRVLNVRFGLAKSTFGALFQSGNQTCLLVRLQSTKLHIHGPPTSHLISQGGV